MWKQQSATMHLGVFTYNEVMFHVVWAIYLLLRRHLVRLFSWLLPVTVVSLQHCLVHGYPQLEAVLIPTTILCTIHSGEVWISAGWSKY